MRSTILIKEKKKGVKAMESQVLRRGWIPSVGIEYHDSSKNRWKVGMCEFQRYK
jgi:hypothetical protein